MTDRQRAVDLGKLERAAGAARLLEEAARGVWDDVVFVGLKDGNITLARSGGVGDVALIGALQMMVVKVASGGWEDVDPPR